MNLKRVLRLTRIADGGYSAGAYTLRRAAADGQNPRLLRKDWVVMTTADDRFMLRAKSLNAACSQLLERLAPGRQAL